MIIRSVKKSTVVTSHQYTFSAPGGEWTWQVVRVTNFSPWLLTVTNTSDALNNPPQLLAPFQQNIYQYNARTSNVIQITTDTRTIATSTKTKPFIVVEFCDELKGFPGRYPVPLSKPGGAGDATVANNQVLVTATIPALTVATTFKAIPASDMTILAQTGTDYTIITTSGYGYIKSTGGGRFAGVVMATGYAGGSTLTPSPARNSAPWVWIGPITEGSIGARGTIGGDILIPIMPGTTTIGSVTGAISSTGQISPGSKVLRVGTVTLINGQGTDAVPIHHAQLQVWQIA